MASAIVQVFLLNGVSKALTCSDLGALTVEDYSGPVAPSGPTAVSTLGIINKSLLRIGVAPIVTLGSDGTPQDVLATATYADVWKEVMKQQPWNALRSRVALAHTTMGLTLSSLGVGTGVTATAASDFFTANDVGAVMQEDDITGATGVSTITVFQTKKVVTVTTTTAWSTLTPLAGDWLLNPLDTDFTAIYLLPSDYLTVRTLDSPTAPWQVEGQRLLTTYQDALLHYTRYESDPTFWDQMLTEAIVAKQIMEWVWPLTKDAALLKNMAAMYGAKLASGEGTNKSERQPVNPRVSAQALNLVR